MPPAAGELVDLLHLGRQHVIGAWRVGEVIVDPGPSSCLPVLLETLAGEAPQALALTHIHLDHAGAAGTLARHFPDVEVWVHERGAPHLVDPARLLRSAERLYGEQMARLWGEVLPVPAERLRVLRGGERIGPFRVAYTPGHASHHVSYLHEPSGRAFTGDVAGVRIEHGAVLAPTPPPDIDIVAWRASLRTIASWRPSSLAVTHFGAYEDVDRHLAALDERLGEAEAVARRGEEAAFARWMAEVVAAGGAPQAAGAYEQAVPVDQSFQGLARYLRRGAG